MANVPFNPGDIVRVKSGGPSMTVKSIASGEVITVWFEGTMKKEGRFVAATLEIVSQ